MSFYGNYPRYCAACGRRNLIAPNSLFGGVVCDQTCLDILRLRESRAIMGKPYDPDAEMPLRDKGCLVRQDTEPDRSGT